jgi:phenylpropionate dioxygenase-like ring-hydroxylating dioxygenase large terminal subunit
MVCARWTGKFSHWNLAKLRSAKRIEYDVRANWKLMFENYSECYHCPGVHPMLSKLSPYDSAEKRSRRRAIPRGFMSINKGKSLTMSGDACAFPVKEEEESRSETAGVFIIPFSEHAPEHASRICDGASALAAVAGADSLLW